MSEKDFLSQFSGTAPKPDSFKEEVRTPVQKPKKPVNKLLVIGILAALIVGALASYVIFFMPKITVPSFVGSSKSDVAAWVKQQGIEVSGIIFKDEYDFDTEKDTILSQDVPAGKKVTNKAKITFGLSLGPDPSEKISVPNLMSMTKYEIQEWSKENKLTSVRFVSSYSDTVEEGNVIKTSNINEDEFKRSTSLEITVSKGPKPANVVKVEDFVGKTAIEAETWAKNNKLEFIKTEVYDEKQEPGKVISQSPSKDKEIKTGETFSIFVSKGKPVYMADIGEWLFEDISYWCGQNGIQPRELPAKYDKEGKGECIEQHPAPGTLLKSGERIEYRLSLGNYISLEATTLDELINKMCDANVKGANLTMANVVEEYSDTVEIGKLIDYSHGAKVGDGLFAIVSKGRNVWLQDYQKPVVVPDPTEEDPDHTKTIFEAISWEDIGNKHLDEEITRKIIKTARESLSNCHFTYKNDSYVDANMVISITRSDGKPLMSGTYLPDDVTLEIVICDK